MVLDADVSGTFCNFATDENIINKENPRQGR